MIRSGDEEILTLPPRPDARRDLAVSLVVLGFIIVLVLSGLAMDGNWRKFLRVLLAFLAYVTLLLALLRGGYRAAGAGAHLPFWPFAVAAAVAELVSGWLRPGMSAGITFSVAPAAALLIGGVHWLALRAWRPLHERILSGRGAGHTPAN